MSLFVEILHQIRQSKELYNAVPYLAFLASTKVASFPVVCVRKIETETAKVA